MIFARRRTFRGGYLTLKQHAIYWGVALACVAIPFIVMWIAGVYSN